MVQDIPEDGGGESHRIRSHSWAYMVFVLYMCCSDMLLVIKTITNPRVRKRVSPLSAPLLRR
jgi:hypothetical protein